MDEAIDQASSHAGIRQAVASPLVERGWFALERRTVPAWRITIPASLPFGTWQVTVDARTGDLIALVDLIRRVEGTGRVYDPNVALSPTPSNVPLYDLDGSGHLSGRITQVFDDRALTAFRPDSVFVFPTRDPRFVQTSVYRGLTDTVLFAEAHGFPTDLDSLRAFTNLVDPETGGEFNNAFYDPSSPAFGFGNGDGVLTANLGTDLDVAAHEMGHHVFQVLVEPVFLSVLDPVLAMTEGVADTFSALIAGDPNIGESTIPGSPFLRTIDNTLTYPEAFSPDPHQTGLVFAGANWDLIQTVGPDEFADILIAGLPFLPPAAQEVEYRDALLQGDQIVTAGANSGLIRSTFSNRGFDDLEFPDEFAGYLEDGLPNSSTLTDGEFAFYVFFEFPGSNAVTFRMTGTGDADLIVAPIATFDPDDPTTYAISAGPTSNEFLRFDRFSVPSVDDDDLWLVAVADFQDLVPSTYTITAEADLPPNGVFIDGPPVFGAIQTLGELDLLTFTGIAGQVVRLEASAALGSDLDPLIFIFDPGTFEVLGADDDSGPGTDALIQGALLPSSKIYGILVLSFVADIESGAGTGAYQLALTSCQNTGVNSDGDALVDTCDDDDDDDGFIDSEDVSPVDPLACADLDLDSCDDCSSGAGFDPFNDGIDSESDTLCDAGDVDDDNDGCVDLVDANPLAASTDQDLDFVGADCDNCPDVANPDQLDRDSDGIGDRCEPSCGDGVLDPGEECDDGNAGAGDGCSATCGIEATGTPGSQKAFTFLAIAESSQFSGLGANSINSSGVVAFETSDSVMAGDGTVVQSVSSAPITGVPSINDSGSVAYVRVLPGDVGPPFFNSNAAVFVGSRSTEARVADTVSGPFTNFGGSPSLNGVGQVAFQARMSDEPEEEGVFLVRGGTRIDIAVDDDLDTASPFGSFGSRVAINDAGEVALKAVLSSGQGTAIYRAKGDVLDEIVNDSSGFADLGSPGAINEEGEVVFNAFLDSDDIGIFVGDGTFLDEVFSTDGRGGATQLSHPAINNLGKVAFGLSIFENAGDSLPMDGGIFVGPDLKNDKVIGIGDKFFGSTVSRLDFFGSMNDSGELSFRAVVDDGRVGIYKAVPVPEPPLSLLMAIAVGALLVLRGRRHVSPDLR